MWVWVGVYSWCVNRLGVSVLTTLMGNSESYRKYSFMCVNLVMLHFIDCQLVCISHRTINIPLCNLTRKDFFLFISKIAT